jgi:hypothetical protein
MPTTMKNEPKSLTAAGWAAIAARCKVKDNGLQKALASYEKAEADQYDDRLKAVAAIGQLGAGLKKIKEVASQADVVQYLGNAISAAESAKGEILKQKALAAKTQTEAQKKAELEAKQRQRDADEDEEEGDYAAKLLAAMLKLKSSKDLAFEFLVCDAKPFCGVIIAKKINSQHKAELTKVTGGGHFLPPGTCVFADGKFDFRMEKPVQGLARKLQDSIKNFTGKKFPIKAGMESEAEDYAQTPGAAPVPDAARSGPVRPSGAAAPHGRVTLEQAPQHWHSTRGTVDGIIRNLKQAVLAEYAGAGQELTAEIDKTMSTLDVILEKLDHRMADSLDKAGAAGDAAARQAELKKSKAILAEYINYVKSEPLIAHIDANPLGIQTNLKQTLAQSLTHMAQAIG